MQRTTYLVDSENVNDAWLKLLSQLKRKDRILIFYTENSPHFTAESARVITESRDKEITWIKCFTGRNALDFQMVSRLGYLICEFPQDAYVLMSNDNGFDAVVRYWMQEGVSISRIRGNLRAMSGILAEKDRQRVEQRVEKQPEQNGAEQKKQSMEQFQEPRKEGWSLKKLLFGKKRDQQEKKPADSLEKPVDSLKKPVASLEKPADSLEKPVPKEEPVQKPEPEAKQPKEIPVSCVLGICKSIPIRKLERIHEALVALLGPEDGREMYHFLKDNREFHEKLKSIYLQEQEDRVINYLQVVFTYQGVEVERMEDVTRILKKYQSGNYNGMYKAMTGSFGQKKGSRYYAVLKPHIRVIKKL